MHVDEGSSANERVRSLRVSKGSMRKVALPHGRASDTEFSRNSSGYDVKLSRPGSAINELAEYERVGTPLLSLESQTTVRDFDVIAFSISFETDYVNMTKTLTEMSVESSRKGQPKVTKWQYLQWKRPGILPFICLWFQNFAYLV